MPIRRPECGILGFSERLFNVTITNIPGSPRAATVEETNGRAAVDPAAAAKPGSAERRSKGGIEGLIGKRVAAATVHALDGPTRR